MTTGSPDRPAIALVPGAWMAAWIWDDTARRLRTRGHEAITLTLPGLEADTPAAEADLEGEADLTSAQRSWLAARFVAHPGRTVLDPAVLARPVTDQHVTFVAGAPTGGDPRADLPPELRGALPVRWQLRTMTGGHWPMLTRPDELVAYLDEAAAG